MPPSYKPSSVSLQGIPDEIFGTQAIDWMDARKAAESLQSQELNNDNNEVVVKQRQQAFKQEQALRDALASQYGGGGFENFDPDEALRTAQRIALQNGDLDTALKVERTRVDRQQGNLPLTQQQRSLFETQVGIPLPEGLTMKDLTTLSGLQRANTYAQQVDTYSSDPNRDLRAQKARREMELGRDLTAEQINEFEEIDGLNNFVDNIKEKYLPYISENRGERFLEASLNPNSAAGRMKQELDLMATQLAAAYNGKRLSDLDFRTMSKLVQPNSLDTLETVADKLDRLKELMGMRKAEKILTLEKGRFNVSGFKSGDMGTPSAETPESILPVQPGSLGKTLPRNVDGKPLSREQFYQMFSGGR